MAPNTRLHAKPNRRVTYTSRTTRREMSGSARDPIVLDDSDEATPPQQLSRPFDFMGVHPPLRRPFQPPGANTSPLRPLSVATMPMNAHDVAVRNPVPQFAFPSGRISKPQLKKATNQRKECKICAHTKIVGRGFKVPKGTHACEHMRDTCSACVSQMLKAKITQRSLHETELHCPWPDCECVYGADAIQQIITTAAFRAWEDAVTTHHLRTSDDYISCLNTQCGHYFAIGGCKNTTPNRTTQRAECPYCQYEHCITCNRTWHANVSCNANKSADEKKSEETIKAIGAKPCPKCGVNIEKISGCDHMQCHQCHHNFCWVCLVEYTAYMQHGNHCIHAMDNIFNDVRNFVDDRVWNANMANQVPQMVNANLNQPPPPPPRPAGVRHPNGNNLNPHDFAFGIAGNAGFDLGVNVNQGGIFPLFGGFAPGVAVQQTPAPGPAAPQVPAPAPAPPQAQVPAPARNPVQAPVPSRLEVQQADGLRRGILRLWDRPAFRPMRDTLQDPDPQNGVLSIIMWQGRRTQPAFLSLIQLVKRTFTLHSLSLIFAFYKLCGFLTRGGVNLRYYR
ncbi:hypothetical protein CC80DRAFT_538110 [Byssothecium circinans]|uniref:RBR-type E3 ubiquitin transferase n=1 Tax=Byssothecium circinans TaxID=147558 RepID=A0A6A5TJB4_9PLEO|nr:hypothetical protein CC80DRAFT_538110 [Byssothecium circinans]